FLHFCHKSIMKENYSFNKRFSFSCENMQNEGKSLVGSETRRLASSTTSMAMTLRGRKCSRLAIRIRS
ncbi:MAG TPA: hypothetical protein VIX59_01800, partial [Candidatus Binataceae bacterium]